MSASKGPRIVHVITGLGLGGAERMLERLVGSGDQARRHSVISLTEGGAIRPRLEAAGVAVQSLGLRRGWAGPAALVRLGRLLRRARPDLIQAWLYHGNLAAWAARAWRRLPVPLVWALRHTPGEHGAQKRLTKLLIRAGAPLSRRVDAVVYNSHASAGRHHELGYDETRSVVIPNGFDTEELRPRPEARLALRAELGLPADARLIGLVARYHPIKDHGTFLAAAARLVAEFSRDVHFVLVGTGMERSNGPLRRRIDDLGLGERVALLGERNDVPGLTAGLDLAGCTSLAESFPNVVGEAMACGVPCVVTDVGDARRIVGSTGLVVPVGDPAALAGAWRTLLELPPTELEERAAAARRRIEERYPLDAVRRRFEDLHEAMIVGRRGELEETVETRE